MPGSTVLPAKKLLSFCTEPKVKVISGRSQNPCSTRKARRRDIGRGFVRGGGRLTEDEVGADRLGRALGHELDAGAHPLEALLHAGVVLENDLRDR